MAAEPRETLTAEKPRYMLVTPQQFLAGYWERDGFLAHHRRFQKIETRPDGTIVVINPRKD